MAQEFQDKWAIIPKRIDEGKKLIEIARELNLSRQRISQVVQKLGLSSKYREKYSKYSLNQALQ